MEPPEIHDSVSSWVQHGRIKDFVYDSSDKHLLLRGDSLVVLPHLPPHSVDCIVTSPPYWRVRSYDESRGLGSEATVDEYVEDLVAVFRQARRVLKKTGSLWLNLGDTYQDKNLVGVPWRTAIALQDDGWILRNAIVWDKVKGNPCNSKDKLRNVYEMLFHFVQAKDYYYDLDAIRRPPQRPQRRNGRVVTPTGVSGVKYEIMIRRSTVLTREEKQAALRALRDTLARVEAGEIPDFRMVIRGQHRVTHSDSPEVSGRARELEEKGFYILPYHPRGSKPGDVWRMVPEDSWRTDNHYAVYPVELCVLPIEATSSIGGVVLDPFVGTGTTLVAALMLGRIGIGVDLSLHYLDIARRRVDELVCQVRLT